MAGKSGPLTLFDRRWLRSLSVLSWLGSAIFFVDRLPLVGIYLGLAGFAFLMASLHFDRRYHRVLPSPPEGYEPTGERYPNPPGGNSVAVYHQGIRRVYVADKEAIPRD